MLNDVRARLDYEQSEGLGSYSLKCRRQKEAVIKNQITADPRAAVIHQHSQTSAYPTNNPRNGRSSAKCHNASSIKLATEETDTPVWEDFQRLAPLPGPARLKRFAEPLIGVVVPARCQPLLRVSRFVFRHAWQLLEEVVARLAHCLCPKLAAHL